MRVRMMAAIAAAGLVTTFAAPAFAAPGPPSNPGQPNNLVTVIIVFAPGAGAASGTAAIRAAGGEVTTSVTDVFSGAIASVPEQAIPGLERNPNIQILERDGVVEAVATQASATWGLDRIDQRTLPLTGAFSYPNSAGLGVSAYIVDTGVLSTHSEFTGRVAPGFTAIADGRGAEDCNGHGTHVAGTVAGTTYGVAKQATVIPVRVLGCNGSGSWSGVISGLDWVALHHLPGAPAVANMSLGGGASRTVDAAVQGAINDGVTVVVAAGNDGRDACNYSPARVSAALTVGATDSADNRASFSNFGKCLDIFAPGVGISSAWSTGTSASATISGTSMASPHVAGAAALVLGSGYQSPATVTSSITGQASSGVVKNAGRGSPNRLLYVGP